MRSPSSDNVGSPCRRIQSGLIEIQPVGPVQIRLGPLPFHWLEINQEVFCTEGSQGNLFFLFFPILLTFLTKPIERSNTGMGVGHW